MESTLTPSADLLALATDMMHRAYAPYSNFKVGAAVRGESGRLFGGCNVENAAYTQGCCAEASAISALVAAGDRRIVETAVITGGDELVTPCGGCRQRLREFTDDTAPIFLCGMSGQSRRTTLAELLPLSFGPAHLKK